MSLFSLESAELVAQVKSQQIKKMDVFTAMAERSVVMQLVLDLVDVSMPTESAKMI
jgi:hypothetical protein